MIPAGEQFKYSVTRDDLGQAGLTPILKGTLSVLGRSTEIEAIVESGARISLLPYHVGFELGLDCEREKLASECCRSVWG